jgi:3-oxoadipate enol-lactonase
VSVDSLRLIMPLHCSVDGLRAGVPVVLLHSICTSSELWRPQLPVWSEWFRIYRMDLPGHGQSMTIDGDVDVGDFANAVAATLDKHGVERAVVVGISLGAMVAQAFALEYPTRTIGLVVAHAGAVTPPTGKALWDERVRTLVEQGAEAHISATLQRWFTEDFARRSPLTLAWIKRLIRETSIEGYRQAVKAIQSLDYSKRLCELRIPTLVVAGEHDNAIQPAVSAKVAEAIEGAQLALLNAAHIGNVEAAVQFTEIVGRFIRALAT